MLRIPDRLILKGLQRLASASLMLVLLVLASQTGFAQLSYTLAPEIRRVGPGNNLEIALLVRNTGNTAFSFGPTNLQFAIPGAPIDYPGITFVNFGPFSGQNNGAFYRNITVGGVGVVTVTIQKNPAAVGAPSGLNPAVIDPLEVVEICRLRIPLLTCSGSYTWQWNSTVGVVTDYNLVNIKPFATYANPINFNLNAQIQSLPDSLCLNSNPAPPTNYLGLLAQVYSPDAFFVTSNIGSTVSPLVTTGSGSEFTYTVGSTTVQDTDFVTVVLGTCAYTKRIIIDGRKPEIIVPAAITRDSLCGTQLYTVQANQPGNWRYGSNSGSTLLTPNQNATAVTIQVTPGPTPQVDTLIVSSPGSCPSAGDTLLLYISPAAIIAGPQQQFICQGSPVSFTAIPGGQYFLITNGTIQNFAGPNLLYPAVTPGIDTIIYVADQCADTAFVVVDPVIVPVISGNPNSFAAPFKEVYRVIPSPPPAGNVYSWTFPAGVVVDSISSDSTYIRVEYPTPGTYSPILRMRKTTAPFCDNSYSFNVNVAAFNCAQVDFVEGDTFVCAGSATALYLPTFTADTLQWQIFNGTSWQNVVGGFGATGQVYLTPIFVSPGTFQYRVIGAVPFCRDTSPVLTVRVTTTPVAGIPAVPSIVECADSSTFVSVVGGSGRIQWQESADGFTWINTLPVDTLNVLALAPFGSSRFYRARFTTLCDTAFANPTFVQRVPAATGSVIFASPTTICPGDIAGPLGASVINGTGRWEKVGGFGGFDNSNNPNASYISVEADAGTIITLNWIVSNNSCTSDTTEVQLFVTPNPAGTFNTNVPAICRLDSTIPLGATVTQGLGRWATDGAGTFLPNDADPNARYVSVLADADRFINLYWIIQVGVCTPDTITRTVYVGDIPSGAFPIAPAEVCINSLTPPLGASVTFGTGTWSTSGSGFFDDPSNPNARYFANEPGEGPVDLNWVVNSGGCSPAVYKQVLYVRDSSEGLFNPALTAICAGSSTPPLNATATRGVGRWVTTNGAGYFSPDSLTPTATYNSDTSDAGKFINLVWIVQNGVCAPDVDSVKVEVLNARVFGTFSGTLADICQNSTTPPLGATVTDGVGQWSTPDGSGSFVPSLTNPNSVYDPGAGDINKTITLQWIVTNGSCNQLIISKPLYIWGAPTPVWNRVFNDRCIGDSTNFLGASTAIGTGKYFTPNGNGYFSPNDSSPLTRYIVDPADGNVDVQIQFITRNGPVCVPDTQTRILRVNNFPAGDFTTVLDTLCAGSETPPLAASASSGIGRWVVVNCGGNFLTTNPTLFPNPNNDPNARYNSVTTDSNKTCTLLWIVDAGGCASDTNVQTVYVNSTLVDGNFVNDLDPICYIGDTSEVLAATVTVGTAVWSTNGTGTFFPNNTDPNARYVPGAGDRGDTVAIRWTISNAACNSVTFSRNLVVQDSAAGRILSTTSTYCYNTPSDPIIAVADEGVGFWRIVSGTGGLSPNNTAPTVTYTPGLGDQDVRVRLEWITTTNPCRADTDTISIYYYRPPSGSFTTTLNNICAGASTQPLGAVLTSGVGTWSSTGAGTFIDSLDPNTQYIAATADAGTTVFLTWTVVNGTCSPDVEVRPVTVLNSIIIAGWTSPIDTICFSEGNTGPLNASLVQGNGRWSTLNGNGVFSDILDPNSSYIFGTSDQAKDLVLSWNVTTAGCDTVRYLDTIRVRETPAGAFPTVLPNICVTDTSDTLVGLVFGTGYGFWDCVNCNGTFTNTDSTFSRYIPDSLDAGTNVTIRWNVTKNFCDTTRYAKILVINRIPAGTFSNPIADICAGQQTVPLGATATVGTGSWSCLNCNGGFTNSLNPNARYISVQEDSGQTVTLVWTITNGACDTLRLTQDIDVLHPSRGGFTTPPARVCSNTPTAPLTGFVVHGSGTWVNNLFGTFANPNDPNTTFTPIFVPRDTTIALTWEVDNGVCDAEQYTRFFSIIAPPRGAIITGISPLRDSICALDSTDLLVAVDSNGVGFWDAPNGAGVFTSPNATVTRYKATPSDANKWIYIDRVIQVPGSNCGTLRLRDSVYINPVFAFNVTPQTADICEGETVDIVSTGGNLYSWITDNGTNFTIIANSTVNDTNRITVRPTPGLLTSYIVTITNNSAACAVKDTVAINTRALQTVTANSNATGTVCDGDLITLGVAGPIQPGGPVVWSPGLNLSDSTVLNPVLTVRGSFTTLNYRVRIQTTNGCFSEDVVSIAVDSTVKPSIQPEYDFCENSVSFLQLGSDYVLCDTIEWYNADLATVLANSNGRTVWGPQHPNFARYAADDLLEMNTETVGPQDWTYRCVRTGRCSGLEQTVVNIRPNPVVEVSVDNRISDQNGNYVTTYLDRTFTFRATTLTPGLQYVWIFGDTANRLNQQITTRDTISFRYTRSGKFTVALFAQDTVYGCNDFGVFTDYITVLDENFFFPNAFSPNKDGLNDTFRALPVQENPRVLNYYIYNRNGQVVYSSQASDSVFAALNNPNTSRDTVFAPQFYALPWNGNDNQGRPLDTGPYTYKAIILLSRRDALNNNAAIVKPTEFTGLIQLIR